MHSGRNDPMGGGRAFFGRRKGKKLRARQTALFETLLPRLALDITVPPPEDLPELFGGAGEVQLEIGFGGGEHFVAEAERHPRAGYIGAEPFVNGMAKALAAIEARALTNIRLHHGDAIEVLAWLPPASLTRIDLLYPDPWPKRRHWKRRFIQDKSVQAIARVLKSDGEFRFASDIPDYTAWALIRLLRARDFTWPAERANDWRLPWPEFDPTRYELKARREGRQTCYLTFRKN